MIPRYTLPAMAEVWSREYRFRRWLDVELAVCRAWARRGRIPEDALKEIEKITKANRKIGLGVMGFAEMLIKLGIPYDSAKALSVAGKTMKFITKKAKEKSGKRNASVTSVAPTGTISIIAGTSSGIEPLFAISFVRNVLEGTELLEVNPLFEKAAKDSGIYSKELMMEIAKTGSVQDLKEIPDDLKRIFVTALDMKPEWHVKMQAEFQKYTDNAVSKTVNLPYDASPQDVMKIYLLAYKLKCKGITVYRYGSKKDQVLNVGPKLTKELVNNKDRDFTRGCPQC